MVKNVTTIPVIRSRYTANLINSKYAARYNYDKQYIQNYDDWEYARLYSDEEITALCISSSMAGLRLSMIRTNPGATGVLPFRRTTTRTPSSPATRKPIRKSTNSEELLLKAL